MSCSGIRDIIVGWYAWLELWRSWRSNIWDVDARYGSEQKRWTPLWRERSVWLRRLRLVLPKAYGSVACHSCCIRDWGLPVLGGREKCMFAVQDPHDWRRCPSRAVWDSWTAWDSMEGSFGGLERYDLSLVDGRKRWKRIPEPHVPLCSDYTRSWPLSLIAVDVLSRPLGPSPALPLSFILPDCQ